MKTTSKTTSHETAAQAYAMSAYAKATALLKVISEGVDGMLPDCREANWSHVGSLASIRSSLHEIARALTLSEAGDDEQEASDIVDAKVEAIIAEGK